MICANCGKQSAGILKAVRITDKRDNRKTDIPMRYKGSPRPICAGKCWEVVRENAMIWSVPKRYRKYALIEPVFESRGEQNAK
ncbi:hypothetical protein DLM86_13630 [Paenibacillus flagellatus]|uniref:Uncharacterized protein n=1 Tax=Paenibacillus flagellatus TaxID=2211139 RepID=A0A2V5K591_9BACL|nr:hypothetical protein DLM86_13630 [Paenibacillus flagellatus]